MSELETLVFDDMINGGKANAGWFSGAYEFHGLDRDMNAQERFDEIAELLKQTEEACGKGNYHFDLSDYISDGPCMIDIPHKLARLVVYEQSSVDWGKMSETLAAYPEHTKSLVIMVSTEEEVADLQGLYGEVLMFIFESQNARKLVSPSLCAEYYMIDAESLEDFSMGKFTFVKKSQLEWLQPTPLKIDGLFDEIIEADSNVKFFIHPGCVADAEFVTRINYGSVRFLFDDDGAAAAVVSEHAYNYAKSMNGEKLKYLCRVAQWHTRHDNYSKGIYKGQKLPVVDAVFIYMGKEFRDALEKAFVYQADVLDEACAEAKENGGSGYDEAKYRFIRSFRGWFQIVDNIELN